MNSLRRVKRTGPGEIRPGSLGGVVGLAAWVFLARPAFPQSPAGGAAAPEGANPDYVLLHQLPSVSQAFLLASGSRLRGPGKERITAVGSVTREQGAASSIEITWEVPQKIRVDEGGPTILYDRQNPNQPVPPDRRTADTIETLLDDSLEGYFANLRERSSRFLGSGFRLQGAGPPAPSYDIVEIWSRSRLRPDASTTVKRYWFDKRTKLLSRVVYRLSPAGGRALVEVFWSDWRDVQGEKIPFTVERKEEGRTTLLVRISSALVSPRAADGRFPGR